MNLGSKALAQELCDVLVIGRGMAGLAATFFSWQAGLKVILIGQTSSLYFASGLFDLLETYPLQPAQHWDNPWEALKALAADNPDHPLAKMDQKEIARSLGHLIHFLKQQGLPYQAKGGRNSLVITALGTRKRTYGLPRSMSAGVTALQQKPPCLFVDFHGYKDFCADLLIDSLGPIWQGLKGLTLALPPGVNVAPECIAQYFETPEAWRWLAQAIKPALKGYKAVGLPALLGLTKTMEAINFLTKELGLPVFEIPTAGPSLPGIRLSHTFDQFFARAGVRNFRTKAVGIEKSSGKETFLTTTKDNWQPLEIQSKYLILATGRFLGHGLWAERTGIVKEPLLNIPISQPKTRGQWHTDHLLDLNGHAVNLSGIMVDKYFRPVDWTGRLIDANLFAAGSILAGQDWKRSKCGTGLAVSSAWGAVQGIVQIMKQQSIQQPSHPQ